MNLEFVFVAQVSAGSTSLNWQVLESINVEQARDGNRANLDKLGGIDAFVQLAGSSIQNGLTSQQVVEMRAAFGSNAFPESPMEGFFSLLFGAFQDPTLLILIAAACVSLTLGIIEDGSHGWVEGAAILIAVFLVANVSAGNDYTKELQFRALEASSQQDERTSVLRDGSVERINPVDVVIGDVVVLQVMYCMCSH